MPRANLSVSPSSFASADLPADVRLMNGTATVLYVLLGLALAAAALHRAVRLPAFAIQRIEVSGEVTRNTPATIRAHAMPKLKGNFFTLDLQQAQQAFESVPWVTPCGAAPGLAGPPVGAARGAPPGRAVGRPRRHQPARRRTRRACSRPTSATSRTTGCRRCTAPTAPHRRRWR